MFNQPFKLWFERFNEEMKRYLVEGEDELGSLQGEQWLDCRQKQLVAENHMAGIETKERRQTHLAALGSAGDGHHTVGVGAKSGVGFPLLREEL